MKRVLVNGGGGFIGGHLIQRLKRGGVWIRAVDLKRNEFGDPNVAGRPGEISGGVMPKGAPDGTEIEIWGDGKQTCSFLYVDECIEGIRRLMESDVTDPVNLGSEEMVTINRLAETIMEIAGKKLRIRHVPGPLGVRGRNSDNRLIRERLQWEPSWPLREGLEKTYAWISKQVNSPAKAETEIVARVPFNSAAAY
jgi:nucleoside-diphosphate-sugar epimerase